MEQMGRWVPGNAPLDEGYWAALLHDGENGRAAPPTTKCYAGYEHYLNASTLAEEQQQTHKDPWQSARALMKQGEIIQLPVIDCNRGGVLVAWNGLQGFVPASHLVSLPHFSNAHDRQQALHALVGSELDLKIIELDAECDRFVLSERVTHLNAPHQQSLLDRLCPGDICQGQVSNLCSFGAFVDLGGVEGLIHISELSWGRVDHPSDALEPGQSVDVYVLNVDRDRRRIGLSLKRLQPDPWLSVEDHYDEGQEIEGTITHVVDFGAFMRIEEGLEGLIHVSELAEGHFNHPCDIVQEGDIVTVRILNIDGDRRRMGLSLREVDTLGR